MGDRKAQNVVLLILLAPLTLLMLVAVGGVILVLFSESLCALPGGVFCR
jgi:hypothetical protein